MILSKRRSADENIGKLIVFSVTIIIAVGLGGIVTYFYQAAREKEVYISVLLDPRSNGSDINELDGFEGCTGRVNLNPITLVYNIKGCTSYKSDINGIEYISTSDISNITYKQK